MPPCAAVYLRQWLSASLVAYGVSATALRGAACRPCQRGSFCALIITFVHCLLAANCVQVDCVLVHVVGSIQAGSSTAFSSSSSSRPAAGAMKFTESFILARSSSGNYYIANQAFQLH